MPLTNGSTLAPSLGSRSLTTASTRSSAISAAPPRGSRRLPGSPWIPIPTSISPTVCARRGGRRDRVAPSRSEPLDASPAR